MTRDGTPWTRNRPDVKALDAIVPRRRRPWRPDRPEIVSLDELHEPPEDADPLEMRISGPVPWER